MRHQIVSERKATRSLKHYDTIAKKIDKIKKHTRIGRYEKELKDLTTLRVAVVCPTCKRPHLVSLMDFNLGKYLKECQRCYDRETCNREKKTLEVVMAALKKNNLAAEPCGVWISDHSPREFLTIRVPRRNYKDKSKCE